MVFQSNLPRSPTIYSRADHENPIHLELQTHSYLESVRAKAYIQSTMLTPVFQLAKLVPSLRLALMEAAAW